MKKKFLLLSILSLLSFNSITGWYIYNSENFKISFPEKPIEENKIVQTLAGETKAKTLIYKSKNINEKNLRFFMSVNDLPNLKGNLTTEEQKTALDAGVNGSVRNHKATLISEKPVQYNSFPGRAVKMSINDDKIIANMRTYIVSNKYYGLIVYTLKQNDDNSEIEQFFSSFEDKNNSK